MSEKPFEAALVSQAALFLAVGLLVFDRRALALIVLLVGAVLLAVAFTGARGDSGAAASGTPERDVDAGD